MRFDSKETKNNFTDVMMWWSKIASTKFWISFNYILNFQSRYFKGFWNLGLIHSGKYTNLKSFRQSMKHGQLHIVNIHLTITVTNCWNKWYVVILIAFFHEWTWLFEYNQYETKTSLFKWQQIVYKYASFSKCFWKLFSITWFSLIDISSICKLCSKFDLFP